MAEYLIGQRYRGSGVTMPGIAGETVPRGAAVYMSAVDGLWYLADSDAAATLPTVGIISDAGATGQVIQILVLGLIERNDWTWTRGDTLYTSGTAGVMTQVAPANTQPVAVALTATLICVNTTLSVVGAAAVAAHVLATTGPHTNTLPLTDLAVGAQGEIIHRGAVDWEALGVGVAGQALTSGGAGANVSWGAGAITHGANYIASMNRTVSTGVVAINGNVRLEPIDIKFPVTLDRIGCYVRAGANNIRFGIYEDNGFTPVGGALIAESGVVAAAGRGKREGAIASGALAAGFYWLAYQCDNVGTTFMTYQADEGAGDTWTLHRYALAFGAFTDPCPATVAVSTGVPFGFVRVASVP